MKDELVAYKLASFGVPAAPKKLSVQKLRSRVIRGAASLLRETMN
jgi:hypothetical protein